MVTAAREEMLREIPHFIPLLWVLIGILVPIVGLVVAVFSVSWMEIDSYLFVLWVSKVEISRYNI